MRSRKPARAVLLVSAAIFTAFAAIDIIVAAAALAALFMLSRRSRVSTSNAILACLVFIPNAIGQLGAYGWPIWGYHYDWIVHICASVIGVILISSLLEENSMLEGKTLLFSFLVVVSLGAAIEAAEYWGFIFFGFGDGYLGFGSGDNSLNFGPWENSSLDTTVNIIGSGLGTLIYYLIHRRPKLSISR
jgi:hypothetical protein